jgi:hypothetical protein
MTSTSSLAAPLVADLCSSTCGIATEFLLKVIAAEGQRLGTDFFIGDRILCRTPQ